MQIDPQRIQRLVSLSKSKAYDPYERFDWPDSLALDRLWCDEDLLTTHGTAVHDRLSFEQKAALSKWEAVNFFSLNVHGIKGVMEFVSRCIYEERYDDISEYLHIFIAEENAHMWFFAAFCRRYARTIYPTPAFSTGDVQDRLEADLYMFASTLVFEEFVDFYNHKVGTNPDVADIVREINHQHHLDESRHVSFGREVVKDLYGEILSRDGSNETRERIARTIEGIIRYFISLMYNPQAYIDAGVVEASGFKTASALRNALRTDPARREHHGVWFRRTADFFRRSGLIEDVSFVTQ
ncbi:diiron oxygenase [Salinarimonas ramus]|uniref:p-aminobenzoate N-oxygenase AurF n=1 Tax=Salinarimonas ramus TaxID=690164 RepID=A0A917Q388_9HYPH|nr:diiron oxygenase [Salinarimonas ramus]GGK17550.1 hypothetical protein GCM10011322_00290 [Salinarimonas ramus]